jgi:ABC-2 type transport system permease protein
MRFFKLTILHLRRLLTDKRVLFLNLLMPAAVICLVVLLTNGQSTNTKMYIDIVNNDKGSMGSDLIKNLKSSSNINVYELKESEAVERVKKNITDGAVLIPKDFTQEFKNKKNPTVKILKLNIGNTNVLIESKINSFITANIAAGKLANIVKSHKNLSYISLKNLKKDLISEANVKKIKVMNKEITKDNKKSLSSQISIGLIISFMMYTIIFIVLEITGRKNDGTLKRCLSTPNSTITFCFSIIASFLILGWIEVLLMIGSTKLLFNLSWGNDYLGLFILFTALILVVLTLGLLICRLVKSESSIAIVSNLTVTVTCMLGGSFMPISYFPDIFKKVSYFTPQRWAVSALTDLTIKNKDLVSILPNVGILLLFAAAFFTAGATYLKDISE